MFSKHYFLINFGTLVLIQIGFIKLSVTGTSDLIIHILEAPERKIKPFSHLTKPKINPHSREDPEPESSNWLNDESEKTSSIDYELVLNVVKKIYYKEKKYLPISTTIKNIPLTDYESINNFTKLFKSSNINSEIFFLSPMLSDETTNWCDFVKWLSLLRNVPSILLACEERSLVLNERSTDRTFLSLLPGVEVTAKSVLSVFRHFWWRKVAMIQASVSGYLFQVCDHLEKEILASHFFSLKVFTSIEKKLFDKDKTSLNKNVNQFWIDVFHSQSSGNILVKSDKLLF